MTFSNYAANQSKRLTPFRRPLVSLTNKGGDTKGGGGEGLGGGGNSELCLVVLVVLVVRVVLVVLVVLVVRVVPTFANDRRADR